MRTLECPLRRNGASAPVGKGAHAIGIVGVPGDQHIEIVRQADQPAVDLAYAQYISSDRTPDGSYRAKGQYAHDLLINNQNELMVVEMKRPQKKGYAADSDSHTNDPVDQLKKQISDIRKKGKISTSGGREINIPQDMMVRGYVLADWNDSLKTYLEMEDLTITNYGGQMAYRYYSALNLMLEVIAFDRLVDRASNRNDAFVQMLEGRSTYDRKPKGTLLSLAGTIREA